MRALALWIYAGTMLISTGDSAGFLRVWLVLKIRTGVENQLAVLSDCDGKAQTRHVRATHILTLRTTPSLITYMG